MRSPPNLTPHKYSTLRPHLSCRRPWRRTPLRLTQSLMHPSWTPCTWLTLRVLRLLGPARRPHRSHPYLPPQRVKLLAGISHLRRGPVETARTSLSSFRRPRHRLLPFQVRSGLRKRVAHYFPPLRKIFLHSLNSLRGVCSCQGTHLLRQT